MSLTRTSMSTQVDLAMMGRANQICHYEAFAACPRHGRCTHGWEGCVAINIDVAFS